MVYADDLSFPKARNRVENLNVPGADDPEGVRDAFLMYPLR